jgi:hypothetical protein
MEINETSALPTDTADNITYPQVCLWPIRPAHRIYNAKLSIGFTSWLRVRLYLSQTIPERPLVASFLFSRFFFIPNMGLTLSISSAGLIGHHRFIIPSVGSGPVVRSALLRCRGLGDEDVAGKGEGLCCKKSERNAGGVQSRSCSA